jgi:hypothetical protein
VIACHEEIADRLLLPRGCRGQVEEELAAAGLGVRFRDDRADGDAISVAFTGTLTASQQAAVDASPTTRITATISSTVGGSAGYARPCFVVGVHGDSPAS